MPDFSALRTCELPSAMPSSPARWGTCRAKCHRFCSGNPSLDLVLARRPRCSAAVAAIHGRDTPPALWSQRERAVGSPPVRKWCLHVNPRALGFRHQLETNYMINVDL